MKKRVLVCFLIAVTWALQSFASVRVASIFSDNMVLQREMYLPVWGTDEPGTEITVTFRNFKETTTTGANGKWKLLLPPSEAGGPFEMTITGSSVIIYRNVMVGEVWFASGQSNMQMTVKSSNDAEKEIAAANHPDIRLFQVATEIAALPQEFLTEGEKWVVCTPETVADFSAAAYFFGRDLHQQYQVPVGLINSSWGGTNIESWISAEMLRSMPETKPFVEWVQKQNYDYRKKMKENLKNISARKSIIEEAHRGERSKVGERSYDDSAWKTMNVPIHYHNTPMSGYEGFVWFRKSFTLPKGYERKGLILTLGKIEQEDETFFNMQKVGSENNTGKLRVYEVPAKAVKDGVNTIAIKVLHQRDSGGGLYEGPFTITDKASGEVLLDLSGEWKYNENIEEKLPRVENYQAHLSTIYNYMVAPIVPFAIKGALWYQGENNSGYSYQYRDLMKALITDWRVQWGEGYFPFLLVQLPGFMEKDKEPTTHGWTEMREAQETATELVNVAMASAIDVGDAMDIHPKNKQDVGKRLFLAARTIAYGEDVISSGPVFKDYKIEGNGVRIRFDMRGNKFKVPTGPLTGFAIAGDDGKFYWAEAVLDGNEVVVKSEKVPNPVAVRYAWSANPELSLFGDSGLPLLPFRTDKWKISTEESIMDYAKYHR
ncbi:MAG: sialate O-acetylesterase [Bacteroidales bacterium]|nr:sialate O-acetylesterase [Bacteroidales bacterium]